MALNLRTRYGLRANPVSTSYPYGSFKDETAPLANNGTPLENDWANDKEAFFQALMAYTGITPNDTVDVVTDSQYLNALLMYMNGTAPRGASPEDICAGMPTEDWADPATAPNYLDTGETIRDACVGWDSSEGRHNLFVAYGTSISKIQCWYYSTSPLLMSPLSITWGAAPDDIMALCSDGDYLYVMWRETAGNVMISKFTVEPWTGVELWVRDTGYDTLAANPWSCRLCIADDDNIGVLIQDDLGASHRARIGVLPKDNSSWSATMFTNYETDFVSACLVSDGTYLYTIGRDESGTPTMAYALLRANISNPATQQITAINSTTLTNYQLFPTALHRVRDMIIITNMQGSIYAYQAAAGAKYTLFDGLPFEWYDSGAQNGTVIGSDGKNLLIQCIEDDEYDDGFFSVFKIPISEFLWGARRSTLVALDTTRIRIAPRPAGSIPSDQPFGRMLFDGRDMWMVTTTGYIYRMCAPGM